MARKRVTVELEEVETLFGKLVEKLRTGRDFRL